MSQLKPFTYTPLPPGHIRLLHVSSIDTRSRELRCKLQVFSLEQRPPFEAFSYAWGTEEASEYIVCNGANLSLTPHLLDGLRSISEAMSVQWLWIDAICIHQSDDTEKASQVMQMWQIYSAASRVVVWMGPSDVTAECISAIRAILKTFDDDDAMYRWSSEELGRFMSPLQIWHDDLTKLFISSWFERLWVVQEVVLAKRAVALYGTRLIELWSVIQLGRIINMTGICIETLPNQEPIIACSFFSVCKYYAKCKLKAEGVTKLINSVRNKQTSERLDRVYAILGLLDEHIREQMVIDYSKASKEEYWKVYIRFCTLVLQEYGESYLLSLSVADRSPMIPSWCLNLDTREAAYIPSSRRRGAGIDAIDERRREVMFSHNGLALYLRAYQVDVIEKALVHPCNAHSDLGFPLRIRKHLSFVSSCVDLALEVAGFEEQKPLASLAKVLVGGAKLSGSFLLDYPLQEAEENLRDFVKTWKDSQLDYTRKLDILTRGSNRTHLQSSELACTGRSLSLTRSGRWVLAPQDAQEGDIIVIIKGFQIPYALRPASGESCQDSNSYRILGPCYMEGTMDGEVLQSEAFKTAGWSEITII